MSATSEQPKGKATDKDVEKILRRAASHIFEDLCFATVSHGVLDPPEGWDIISTVAFEGEFAGETRRGALILRLHQVDPAQLAEAMLGDAEDLDDKLALDAVGELTNVVCGNVLPDVVDLRANFDLRHPDVRRAGHAEPPSGDSVKALVAVEDGLAEIELIFTRAESRRPSLEPSSTETSRSTAP